MATPNSAEGWVLMMEAIKSGRVNFEQTKTFFGMDFSSKPDETAFYIRTPPLHGAIDYRKRPDGVWEMPK